MLITLTAEDFRKLSPGCRQEILAMLDEPPAPELNDDGDFLPQVAYMGTYYDESLDQPTVDDALGTKRVVGINVEQARELIANVSEKSKKTLKLFAVGRPIALDELIGESGPYRDFTELKRSFVGAVNRRLRTVTENRLAMLFASDRDKTRIRITPKSAASLRLALDIPEGEAGTTNEFGPIHSDPGISPT